MINLGKLTEVLTFNIKIGKRKYTCKLDKELGIDRSDMNLEMSRQPAHYAWYASLTALARDFHVSLVNDRRTLYANLDSKYRDVYDDRGLKITEKAIENGVLRDSEYVEFSVKVSDAKLNLDLLQAAMDSFQQRKDMLISISSNMRVERDLNLVTLKEDARKVISNTKRSKFSKSNRR